MIACGSTLPIDLTAAATSTVLRSTVPVATILIFRRSIARSTPVRPALP